MSGLSVFTFPYGQGIEPARLVNAANSISAVLEERNCKSAEQNARRNKEGQEATSVTNRLSMIIEMVKAGRISDFVFVGRDSASGHFLTEVAVKPPNPSDTFAFVGVLNALNLELTDKAQLSPELMPDGSVLDPYMEARR